VEIYEAQASNGIVYFIHSLCCSRCLTSATALGAMRPSMLEFGLVEKSRRGEGRALEGGCIQQEARGLVMGRSPETSSKPDYFSFSLC
jgi:hypothetical protein